jgi:hypothetical protein
MSERHSHAFAAAKCNVVDPDEPMISSGVVAILVRLPLGMSIETI